LGADGPVVSLAEGGTLFLCADGPVVSLTEGGTLFLCADGPVVSLAEGGTFFPKRCLLSSVRLRFNGPDVRGSAPRLCTLFVVFVAVRRCRELKGNQLPFSSQNKSCVVRRESTYSRLRLS